VKPCSTTSKAGGVSKVGMGERITALVCFHQSPASIGVATASGSWRYPLFDPIADAVQRPAQIYYRRKCTTET
jgi:hypothetical protein